MTVLAAIKAQIDVASDELTAYRPESMDWHARATATAEQLVPWLAEVAPALKNYVQDVHNAPVMLRQLWESIRGHVGLPREQIEAFDRQLTLDDVFRGHSKHRAIGERRLHVPLRRRPRLDLFWKRQPDDSRQPVARDGNLFQPGAEQGGPRVQGHQLPAQHIVILCHQDVPRRVVPAAARHGPRGSKSSYR